MQSTDSNDAEHENLRESDLALVDRALARDPRAMDQLGDRLLCVPRFLAQRNRRMGRLLDDEDLRDATQEAIAILWQKLPDFRGEARFETWCYAIAGGAFMNAVRRHQRLRAPSLADLPHSAELISTDPEPNDYTHVYRCLAKLPAEDEFLVRARAFDDWSFEQIAEHGEHTVAGLKARYYRALRKLQLCLAPILRREQ